MKTWSDIFNQQRQKKGLLQDLWDSFNGHCLLFQKVLEYTPMKETVCEMGVGRGYNLLYLVEKGYKGVAIDLDKNALSSLKYLADKLEIDVGIFQVDFSDKEKLFPVYTIFNSGVMEHFSKEKLEKIFKIWASVSKVMVLSIPFKGLFSNNQRLHGDEIFYSFKEIKDILRRVPEIQIKERIACNKTYI